uniref:Ig-like domain-containing protein n=1 Tax=Sinocyclocheilus anshuiensis TaxID=1608454 RepID=A0A671KCT2_9TELE
MVVTLVVQTQSPNIMSLRARDVSVFLGNPVSLDCIAVGKPEAQISWILPDRTFVRDIGTLDRRVSLFPNGTLSIHSNINPNDSGRYECSATNPVGFAKRTVQMDVRQEAPGPWKGLYQQHSVMATYGSTVFLHCPESLGRFQVHRNGTLELRGIRKTDEGRFLCIAKNYLGEASLAVDLEVTSLAEKPSFPVPNIEVLPLEADGDDISLECRATGKPKPEFLHVLLSLDFFNILYLIYEIIGLYIFLYSTD